jgi:hypothetical protein
MVSRPQFVIWVREDEVGMPSGGVVVLLAATSFQVSFVFRT